MALHLRDMFLLTLRVAYDHKEILRLFSLWEEHWQFPVPWCSAFVWQVVLGQGLAPANHSYRGWVEGCLANAAPPSWLKEVAELRLTIGITPRKVLSCGSCPSSVSRWTQGRELVLGLKRCSYFGCLFHLVIPGVLTELRPHFSKFPMAISPFMPKVRCITMYLFCGAWNSSYC